MFLENLVGVETFLRERVAEASMMMTDEGWASLQRVCENMVCVFLSLTKQSKCRRNLARFRCDPAK